MSDFAHIQVSHFEYQLWCEICAASRSSRWASPYLRLLRHDRGRPYGKIWRHPLNRKYITYRNWGEPSPTVGNVHIKLVKFGYVVSEICSRKLCFIFFLRHPIYNVLFISYTLFRMLLLFSGLFTMIFLRQYIGCIVMRQNADLWQTDRRTNRRTNRQIPEVITYTALHIFVAR